MMWPVGVLAVLSTIAGFLQVPGAWALRRHLARARRRVRRGGERRARRVLDPRLAGRRRRGHRRRLGRSTAGPASARRRSAAASRGSPATLEHKLYFDEAYDLVFYKPISRVRGLARCAASRSRSSSARSAASAQASATSPTGWPPPRPAGCAPTSSRSPSASPSWPSSSWWSRDHDHPDPAARSRPRSRSGSFPWGSQRAAGGLRAARRARRAGALGGHGAQLRLRRDRPPGRGRRHVVRRPRRLLPGGLLRLLALAGRPHRRGHQRPRSGTASGRGASASAST